MAFDDTKATAAAVAALAICAALLLSLSDLTLMSNKQIDDAAAPHRDADSTKDFAVHREVVAILKRIKSSARTLAAA